MGARKDLKPLFCPTSVAIIGATETSGYGQRMMENLIKMGFRGKAFPVNPKRKEVMGLRVFPSVRSVPEVPDLAIFVIPASAVPDAMLECAEIGIRAGLIISSGFAETGTDKGAELQRRVQEICSSTNMRVCGPNCLGVANVAIGLWATSSTGIDPSMARFGPIGLISQSGASAFGPVLSKAVDREIGLKYIVSAGNEADLKFCDYAEYMLEDPDIRVVAALVEGFRDAGRLREITDLALRAGKSLVMLKIGRSAVGAKAALTHTAALTGEDSAYDAFFRQKGITRVNDYDQLVEVAGMFAKCRLPAGRRVAIVSHSGGISSLAADVLSVHGLDVPEFSTETVGRLRSILDGRGSPNNPADVTTYARGEEFRDILRSIYSDQNVDMVVLATHGPGFQARNIIDAANNGGKPTLLVWTHRRNSEVLTQLRKSPVAVFESLLACAKGASGLARYAMVASRVGYTVDVPVHHRRIAGRLTEYDSKSLLASEVGIPTPKGVLCQGREGLSAASALRPPWALKAVLPGPSHKTDVGGVILNIRNERELYRAYDEMMNNLREKGQALRPSGVLVEEMILGGLEVIVGICSDRHLGPIVMMGWGGAFAEAMGLVTWRVCPVSSEDVCDMIDEVKGLKAALNGYRGMPRLDVGSLVDAVTRLSAWAHASREWLESLDINPLVVLPEGQRVCALDCKIQAKES